MIGAIYVPMLLCLQVLWLADNYISSLSGISALQQLQQLNLARNDISSIGSSLLSHTALTSLNLADNKISNFQVSKCPEQCPHQSGGWGDCQRGTFTP
jgi:Leucine-rich repeat (LRR) protein